MENYKDIDIKGRKFRIIKFDARTGSYMLIKISGLIAPLIKNLDLKAASEVKEVKDIYLDKLDIVGAITKLSELPEKDFNYIQDKCLRACKESLAAGFVNVLNENGTFGAANIEDDTMLVMSLTVHALIFNVTGFFSGSPLASLIGGTLTTFQQG